MVWLGRVVAACCLTCLSAAAQTPPAFSIDVPPNEKLVLQAHGKGVQIYSCVTKEDRWTWTLKGPEAKLFDDAGNALGSHFAGPKWRLADGSEIQGKLLASQPHAGTIAWLLLSAISTGNYGKLNAVNLVRRTETLGGVAPSSGCDAEHVGVEARVDYSAVYSFYASR